MIFGYFPSERPGGGPGPPGPPSRPKTAPARRPAGGPRPPGRAPPKTENPGRRAKSGAIPALRPLPLSPSPLKLTTLCPNLDFRPFWGGPPGPPQNGRKSRFGQKLSILAENDKFQLEKTRFLQNVDIQLFFAAGKNCVFSQLQKIAGYRHLQKTPVFFPPEPGGCFREKASFFSKTPKMCHFRDVKTRKTPKYSPIAPFCKGCTQKCTKTPNMCKKWISALRRDRPFWRQGRQKERSLRRAKIHLFTHIWGIVHFRAPATKEVENCVFAFFVLRLARQA